MVILITGGAGFIGSHLSEQLLQQGHQVVCIDNLDEYIYCSALKRENLSTLAQYDNLMFMKGDIRDKAALQQLLVDYQCELVIHLAAYAGVRPSVMEPEKFFEINVNGTLAVLEAMRKAGVRRMIMASSSSVYGNSTARQFKETDAADQPISPYAASKRAAELVAYSYHSLHQFDITCLRLFTVFGPRQRPEMAIRKFIERIQAEQPIDVYGDGQSIRNYTYISDVVNAFLKAMDKPTGFNVYNIAGPTTTSLLETIEVIEKQVGKQSQRTYKPEQAGDMRQTAADISKAQQELGYFPQVEFEEGISRVIDWMMRESSKQLPIGTYVSGRASSTCHKAQ